ncbi:MAG: hypothetical protein WC829_11935 [Hyphomicrobium sp.]|jgi:hypothetical protein
MKMLEDAEYSKVGLAAVLGAPLAVEDRLAQLERHYVFANEQLQNARRHNHELGLEIERLTKEAGSVRVAGRDVQSRVVGRCARAVFNGVLRFGRRVATWVDRRLPSV